MKSATPPISTEEIAARLEALGQHDPQTMPTYLEARIRQQLSEATLSLPEGGRVATLRRLIALLVAFTVLWTLYLSYLQHAHGVTNTGPNAPPTRSVAEHTHSIAAVRNGAQCK